MRENGLTADSAAPGESIPGTVDSGQTIHSLTEEQLGHLRERGYVRIDRVVSIGEVVYIRDMIEKLFAAKAGFEEGAHFNFAGPEDDPNAPSFPQIVAPHNYAANLRKTRYYKHAIEIARQILGPEARFQGDHTLMKPAINGPATPWHQDEAFRNPEFDYQEISIWLPLQPVGEVNGCMQFIPGTHLKPVLPHRSPGNDPRVHGLECYTGFSVADAVACPLPRGSCTIHTGRTLHAAGPNRSAEPRYAYVLNFAVPPVPAAQARSFPWLADKDTARLHRMRSWLRRGGVFVEVWRLVKRTEPRDYGKLLSQLVRKAGRVRLLARKRKSAAQ